MVRLFRVIGATQIDNRGVNFYRRYVFNRVPQCAGNVVASAGSHNQDALGIRMQEKRNVVLAVTLLLGWIYLPVRIDGALTKVDNALIPGIVYVDKILVERKLWQFGLREGEFLIGRPNHLARPRRPASKHCQCCGAKQQRDIHPALPAHRRKSKREN